MAKNTKNNLYDIEKENKSKNTKSKKNIKNNKNVNKSVNKKEKTSFDNEIIIGVTNLTREHIDEDNNKKKKKNVAKKKVKQNEKKQPKKQKQPKVNKKEVVEKVILDEEVFLEQRKEERKEKRKRNFKIAKILMILALIIATILIILFSPLFNIKEIEVKNNELISTEQILNLSGIKKDVNTFKVNTGSVSNQIKENLYIEDAEIIRELPSKIVINIKERKPSFIIEYANGYATIDRTGFILELSETKKELPIIQGLETVSDKFQVGKKLEKGDINKIYIISKIVDIANSNDMGNLITRIDIENTKEIKLIIESKEKTAYIGDDSNLNIKLLTIKQMIEKTEGLAGEILVNIDLNSEYPVFRERV
ncbi:MAG: FtsQ-type POTRA domain-containing protein [Clostridia bacterium]|nr:FtsQ-type POTRA domain-containing protein [Clostridia bacterium]